MVVILRDAATVFGVEYRRYVRTRRYWVLALTALALGALMCAVVAALAATAPRILLASVRAAPYLPAYLLGWLAAFSLAVQTPLAFRMVQDVYKTRPLSDLYLTELHPLGVVLGRAGATTALTGLVLMLLTPAALWLMAVLGAPLWGWAAIACLTLGAHCFGACLEAFSMREYYSDQAQLPAANTRRTNWYTTLVTLTALAGLTITLLTLVFARLLPLTGLTLWAFSPITAPVLLYRGLLGEGWRPMLWGLPLTLGFGLWAAVAAAQWRDWWSDGAYRALRWGGTAFWTVFVGVHAAFLAEAYVDNVARAERWLFGLLTLTTLLNLTLAPLLGYYGVARRPRPLRTALPYPWGGIVWQWALHGLTAGALYLSIGLASGVWVAPAKLLFWTAYLWVAFVLLGQAVYSWMPAYYRVHPTHLQGDYVHGYFINTRVHRVALDNLAQIASYGVMIVLAGLGVLIGVGWVFRLGARLLAMPALGVLGDWALRIHPWWGVYGEWLGVDTLWYLPYAALWTIGLWSWGWRTGVRRGFEAKQSIAQWRAHVMGESTQAETRQTVA